VNDEDGLIGLLQRADWTRLSLAAEMNDGSTVLIAPGKRYRYQHEDYLTGCDGPRPWEQWLADEDEDEDEDGSVHWVSGPEAPLARLLCPAWLLDGSQIDVVGRTQACGRQALDVAMIKRPSLRISPAPAGEPLEPVRVLVDAELGILLRAADPQTCEDDDPDDAQPGLIEFVSADFDPVIDHARFAPPQGSRLAEGASEAFGGPGWQVARNAAGLAAGALGAWIKLSSRRAPAGAAPATPAAIPSDEPAPDLSGGVLAGPPLSGELLSLLHAGGPGELTATMHQWIDLGAMAKAVPASARRSGFGGLGLLMDAVSETAGTAHHVAAIRLAGPCRYQFDYASQAPRQPVTIACDGQRRWQVYPDKITTGPAEPPPDHAGNLADPSWLLRWSLSGGEAVTVAGRACYRITAALRGDYLVSPLLFPAAVACLDVALGIIVRLTSYLGGRPVQRFELRDIGADAGDFQVVIPSGLPVTAAD
jgi:hypothetical protein